MAGVTKAWALRRTAQVVTWEALERTSGRRPQLPRSPSEVSPQWLSGAGFAGVVSVSAGDGSTGTTTRQSLHLGYDERIGTAERPERIFVKCTSSLAQRLMLGLGGLVHGEPGFYGQVRPLLEIEAPTSYFGAVEQRSWRSILLLEDVVHTRGARFWQAGSPVTRAQIEDLLGTVATWHGRLWDSPRMAAWRWLKTPADQLQVIDALLGLADRRRAGLQRAWTVVPPSLRSRPSQLHEGMRRSMQLASRGPRTYLHGDLHIANTYVTDLGTVGVCDWQVGLQGSWAHDYSYLVATALTVEERRAWERDLLTLYLDRLAAAGGDRLDPEGAWLSYRQALLYPYFAWLYTIGRARLQPSFQPQDTGLTLIGRIAAAIDDLDALAATGV